VLGTAVCGIEAKTANIALSCCLTASADSKAARRAQANAYRKAVKIQSSLAMICGRTCGVSRSRAFGNSALTWPAPLASRTENRWSNIGSPTSVCIFRS
jgi:hypothetical protein